MRTLETERLIIRAFVEDDLADYTRLISAAFGVGDGPGPGAALPEQVRYNALADKVHEAIRQPPYGDRAVVLKETRRLVGSVGFVPCLAPFGQLPSFERTPYRTPELGLFYALVPEHWGKGFATEAARAMVAYAFNELRVRRVVATTEHDNVRSIAVMRRLGMRILRNPFDEPAWFQTIGVLDNATAA